MIPFYSNNNYGHRFSVFELEGGVRRYFCSRGKFADLQKDGGMLGLWFEANKWKGKS